MSQGRTLHRLLEAGKRLSSAKGGNVAVIFAVALVPMVMATLGVVQYETAVSVRTKLNAVADAAALQAVSRPAVLTYVSSSTTGQANATSMFTAQAAQVKGATITSLSVSVTPAAATTTAAGSLTATVGYTATLTSLAPGFFGSFFTTVTGTSTATASIPAYANFYLLLDGSPSMGIGSTAANIATMQTQNGCAFACHSPGATPANYPGFSPTPVQPTSMLRIGALQSATSQLVSTAISSQQLTNQYKIGVYSFANTVTTISSLTTNLSQIQTDINNLTLPTTDIGTQIGDAVNWLSQNVVTTASGTGTLAAPYEYVFLVTDGVEDHYFNFQSGSYDTLSSPQGQWYSPTTGLLQNYSGVMQSSACTSLKNKGVTVAVLYTNYDPAGGTQYPLMVAPFAGNIAGALQACASPNFFFQADSASSINSAMQQMFALALQQSAHLSQ
jgi:Flp pilus assembly protein TadG